MVQIDMATRHGATKGGIVIKICAWCKRRLVNGEWIVDDDPDRAELVSHGLCEDCYEKHFEETEREES